MHGRGPTRAGGSVRRPGVLLPEYDSAKIRFATRLSVLRTTKAETCAHVRVAGRTMPDRLRPRDLGKAPGRPLHRTKHDHLPAAAVQAERRCEASPWGIDAVKEAEARE